MQNMVKPSSATQSSSSRCLSVKNSRVPCVASPSETMRASPMTARSGARSAKPCRGSAVVSGIAAERIHSTTAAGAGGGLRASVVSILHVSVLLRCGGDGAESFARRSADTYEVVHSVFLVMPANAGIHVLPAAKKVVDGRDIGERSDAVLRTAMPGRDGRINSHQRGLT